MPNRNPNRVFRGLLRPRYPLPGPEHRRNYQRTSNARINADRGQLDRVRFGKTKQTWGDYRVLRHDEVVRVMAVGSDLTITLPSAALVPGYRYRVEDASGNAAAAPNDIAVQGPASQTISGAAEQAITSAYGTITVRSDGENWVLE